MKRGTSMRSVLQRVMLMLGLLAVVGNVAAFGGRGKARELQEIQDEYAAAIRWNNIEGAVSVVDPEYLKAHPPTELQLARYRQLQISGYNVLRTGNTKDNEVQREVEIRMINRNTQAERSVRVRESWRWDARSKKWWLSNGLPDLWNGE